MDDIVAELLGDTGALGVWLLGTLVITDNQPANEVLAAAVKDPSIRPPSRVLTESECFLAFDERQIFAAPHCPWCRRRMRGLGRRIASGCRVT